MKNLKEFKPLLKYLKNSKGKLIIASTLIVITAIIGMSYGILIGLAIEALTNMDLRWGIIYLLICLGVAVIFRDLLFHIAFVMLRKIEAKVSAELLKDVYNKVLDLPAYAFEIKTSGELINRLTNDTASISDTFNRILDTFVSILTGLIILVFIFYNSIIIGMQTIVVVLLFIALAKYFNPRLKKVNKKLKETVDVNIAFINESIRGIREVKTLGIKNNMFSNISRLVKIVLDNTNKEYTLDVKYDIITHIVGSIYEIGVFITCGILFFYGHISLAFFIAMTYYVYRYTWLIANITETNKRYQKVLVSMTRLNELLENRIFEDEKFGNKIISKPKGIIEFKNVKFNYKGEESILKGMDIKFEPNKKIGIVGKSGGGKSTIFNLITKIFDVREGKILIDNININDLTEDALRNSVSIVRQEPFIFNNTIKENFKVINPKISLKEIREYMRLAYLDDYVMSLPKQYDTLIGEGGTNLSGGQKQRLAIARCLAKKSKIILFDEATSALDNESQEYINKTIDNLVKNHTIIVIAHRLSTIKNADVIYVIDDGKVENYGTHKELLKSTKSYKDLYREEM